MSGYASLKDDTQPIDFEDFEHMTVFRTKTLTGVSLEGFDGNQTHYPPGNPIVSCRWAYHAYNVTVNDHQIVRKKTSSFFNIIKRGRYLANIEVVYHNFVDKPVNINIVYALGDGTMEKIPRKRTRRIIRGLESCDGLVVMKSIRPKLINRVYKLNFKQKGIVPSVKNFQIKLFDRIVLEVVKKRDRFGILYREPFSPELALSVLMCKLME